MVLGGPLQEAAPAKIQRSTPSPYEAEDPAEITIENAPRLSFGVGKLAPLPPKATHHSEPAKVEIPSDPASIESDKKKKKKHKSKRSPAPQEAPPEQKPASDTAKPTQAPESSAAKDCGEDKPTLLEVPVIGHRLQKPGCAEPNKDPFSIDYGVDYDKGFVIRALDPEQDKFQMKINSWIQFRHAGFIRDSGQDSWTGNAGVTRPVRARNAFENERSRLTFKGHLVDKRFTYFLQLDGDTDGRETVDFFDYWFAWKFSDAFRLQFGKRKVSASRRWLMGARDSRFSDRPMATDFFRPDRTTGLWALGSFDDLLFYEATIGNGYRTANRNLGEVNDRFVFSLTQWWDAAGKFGNDLTDHAISEEPLIRVGHSFTYSRQSGRAGGSPLRETDFIRLTDGTRLTDAGALAPGTQVDDFDLLFYAVDFGWKSMGWSVSAEAYFRWLNDIGGTGVLPIDSIEQRGFFVEGGSVLYKDVLDWNVRYSQIAGDYGEASEVGIGLNWYPLESRDHLKVTFDISRFDGSPLNNTASDILVGENGTLFRTQVQAQF